MKNRELIQKLEQFDGESEVKIIEAVEGLTLNITDIKKDPYYKGEGCQLALYTQYLDYDEEENND